MIVTIQSLRSVFIDVPACLVHLAELVTMVKDLRMLVGGIRREA